MKRIFTIMSLAIVLLFTVESCNNAAYSPEKDMAYILQTNTMSNISQTIKIADENITNEISARLSDRMQKDAQFTITADSSILTRYNKKNRTTLKMLPSDFYSISNDSVIIKSGSTISNSLKFIIKPITKEMISSGVKYAIAFKLQSTNGVKIINGADEIVYILEPVVITNCPVLGTYNYRYYGCKGSAEKEQELKQWTVEMRVNLNGYLINNQALFGNWGPGSEIYIRFGDAAIPYNCLQVKFGSAGQFDRSNTQFTPNTWYDIAVVYDGTKCTLYINGQKDLDTDKPAGTVFHLGRDFWVCSSGRQYFRNTCMMSELRVWNIARTKEQIIANQYGISPNTEGLIHYWKMDEGTGYILHDSVKENKADLYVRHDLSSDNYTAPVWADNIRSDGKGRTNLDNL